MDPVDNPPFSLWPADEFRMEEIDTTGIGEYDNYSGGVVVTKKIKPPVLRRLAERLRRVILLVLYKFFKERWVGFSNDEMHSLPRRGKMSVAQDEIRGNENDECIRTLKGFNMNSDGWNPSQKNSGEWNFEKSESSCKCWVELQNDEEPRRWRGRRW